MLPFLPLPLPGKVSAYGCGSPVLTSAPRISRRARQVPPIYAPPQRRTAF